MEVHPSQKRISCNICRKNKVKCQRMRADDPKCVRCTLANEDCEISQQRKVGRPRRIACIKKSAVKGPSILSHRRPFDHPKSRPSHSNISEGCNEAPTLNSSASSMLRPPNSQRSVEDGGVLCCDTSVDSGTFTSITTYPDLHLLEWPTFITDGWYRMIHPRSHAPQTFIDLKASTLRQQRTGMLAVPASNKPTTYSSVKNDQCALPFGIGRPPAYYIQNDRFSSNPADVTSVDLGKDGSGAMARLASMIHGLRMRSSIIQTSKSSITLSLIIHRQGPLYVGSFTLAEYIMISTQDLVQIVTGVIARPEISRAWDEELWSCVVANVMDVYCRILSFFELFLEHLTDRVERVGADPVVPIPGMMFNETLLVGPCTQGTLFSSTLFHLLNTLDNALGLGMNYGSGFLSTSQIDLLYRKLDGSDDLVQTKGIMRPADAKKLMAQVSTVLERLAYSG